MLKAKRLSLLPGVWLGLFVVGNAFGYSATIGPIAGYTSTNFTYITPAYTSETTNGGLVHVSATFTKPIGAGNDILGLVALVTLPEGWTVDYDQGELTGWCSIGSGDYFPNSDGSHASVGADPQYDLNTPGLFTYVGSPLGTQHAECEFKLNFDIYVPAGHRGDEALSIAWYVTPSVGSSEWVQSTDNGQLIEDLNPPLKTGTLIFVR